MRWLRHPVVHFVVLGGLLFALKNIATGVMSDRPPGEEPAVITRERIEELLADWRARTGAPADAATRRALIESEIDDTVLILEARRLGVHRSDPVVQRRLLRNMRFLGAGDEREPGELLDEAYALGMDRSDLVVRRRLIQRLSLDVLADARHPEPGEAELAEYLRQHPERFTEPARVRLSHLFLSRDRRGAALEADARALLAELHGVGPDGVRNAGDPFLFPRDLPARSERDLAKTFGPEFAARAVALPVGQWSGPVPSAYGLHLVWVHERTPAALSDLASVRGEVREALLGDRGRRALRAYVKELRDRTPVSVETAP